MAGQARNNLACPFSEQACMSNQLACCAGGVQALLLMLRKLKGTGSSSVGWHSIPLKSTVRASMRGGVPVLSLLSLKPCASNVLAKVPAGRQNKVSACPDRRSSWQVALQEAHSTRASHALSRGSGNLRTFGHRWKQYQLRGLLSHQLHPWPALLMWHVMLSWSQPRPRLQLRACAPQACFGPLCG